MMELLYQKFLENPIISTDSRNITLGAIFFALKGDNFDGNKFAQKALETGASVAVIDNPDFLSDGCILVDNTLNALQSLARHHRKMLGIRIIGITGSNGKTTTKELLAAVLASKYNVYATKGNLNNHIGVPLTLLSLTDKNDIAIVEMGANHPGDIKELAEIAEPNFGLITNIGRAHLGGFGSFEGVISTKAELYRFIAETGGKVFFNQENPILSNLIHQYRMEERGISYDSICKTHQIVRNDGDPFLAMSVVTHSGTINVQSSLVGDYNAENLLAAFAVGSYFNVPLDDIKAAIENYVPSNNRSQFLKTETNTIIMDAYNANPSSMEASIRNFARLDSPNKRVILGEMLELGQYAMAEHKKIVDLLIELNLTQALLVGDEFRTVCGDFEFFPDSDSCVDYLTKSPMKGCTVLLKGSRGVRLEKLMSIL